MEMNKEKTRNNNWSNSFVEELYQHSDCPDFALLSDYANNKLQNFQIFDVENHLTECRFCSAVVDSLQEITDSQLIENEAKLIVNKIESNVLNKKTSDLDEKINFSFIPFISNLFQKNVIRYSFSALLIFALIYVFSYKIITPEYYYLARLNPTETEMIKLSSSSTRGNDATQLSNQDITSLLDAETQILGLFPVFDKTKIEKAIKSLTAAYNSTDENFYQQKYAYFLGKAFLMENDKATALKWFITVDNIKLESFYKNSANNLISKLK